MNARYVGLICGVLGVFILLWPSASRVVPPTPPIVERDMPAIAFDTYEKLWRKTAAEAAEKLAAGQLETEQKVWDFIAAAQAPARKAAFDELAKSEQDYFAKNGGWSAKAHETLLRSYVK
jgi:hypothetical protein